MTRGTLRIYLGAAPGVGKTFAMLNEGWRRKERGTDVVVGYVEDHDRPNTRAQLRDLEIVPRAIIDYRGQRFEEMDVAAVLARHPAVALVDELAHSNVAGSSHPKRWQDVEELLAAGIDVISTLNIQHLESLNDVVQRITGVTQRETIPDSVVRAASQVELVDMAPEALRRRMAHGNIYAADNVDAALSHYFRVGNLSALRELALLWVADKVDEGLHDYRDRHGISEPWETRERVVVALTGSPQGQHLVRRAARMALRSRAELVGVHIRSGDGLARPGENLIEANRSLLTELGGRYEEITGSDVPSALVAFARAENATQLLLGASGRSRAGELLHGSVINQVIRAASDGIDVHVISSAADRGREERPGLPKVALRGHLAVLPRRRVLAGWFLAIIVMPAIALTLTLARGTVHATSALPLLLLGAAAVAGVGGVFPGLAAALVGFGFADWYFIPPVHSLSVDRGDDALALLAFVVVAVIVSFLNDQLARRRLEVARARSESEALARLAGGAFIAGPEALPTLAAELRSTFGLDAVAILTPAGDRNGHSGPWIELASAGTPAPASPDEAPFSAELGDGAVLVLAGSQLRADDRRLLTAFVAQLRLAQTQGRLQAQAASAKRLAESNDLRTALLAAVSHDLRNPLATIKASATSLLSDDVQWSPEAVRSICQTIDIEADRLNILVANLLDMSRLQTGALDPAIGEVALDEVADAALASLSRDASKVAVDVPHTLPSVRADAALLERAVANLIDNALNWTGSGPPVRVEAGQAGDRVYLRIVDHGPGIPDGPAGGGLRAVPASWRRRCILGRGRPRTGGGQGLRRGHGR